MTKVWIDQDLCTGDGLCAEICPDVFWGQDDGLYYVKETAGNYGSETLRRQGQPRRCRRPGLRARQPARQRHRSRRGVPGRVHLHRGRRLSGRMRPRGASSARRSPSGRSDA
ncbi:MAG: ferredoxin [Acidimicrobiales bacterium]